MSGRVGPGSWPAHPSPAQISPAQISPAQPQGGGAAWTARRRRALAAVAVGIAADWLLGEPPDAWHPVAGFGRAMERLEAGCYSDSRGRGAAFATAGAGTAALLGWLLDRFLDWLVDRGPSLGAGRGGEETGRRAKQEARGVGRAAPAAMRGRAGVAVATYIAVAGKALAGAAGDVAAALDAGDLAEARVRLPALVGRDPAGLAEPEIVRAEVESVAENTVDAVVAAAVWAAIGGAPAVLAYRAVNTLDAMVGHLTSRYTRFGWAAARADDLAGWVPARLTALLRPAAAAHVWAAVRYQARRHPSPNAGVAEAAFAAALGVRVGGWNAYDGRPELRLPLGTGTPPTAADIARAVRLSRQVTAAIVLLGLAGSRCRWRP